MTVLWRRQPAVWVTLLLVIVPFANRYGLKLASAEPVDFPSYFWAAHVAFVDRASPYAPDAFVGRSLRAGQEVLPFIYPPPSLLLFAPLAAMPYGPAKVALLALNHACLLASVLILLSTLDLPARARVRAYVVPLLVLYVYAMPASGYNMEAGQVNIILLLLLSLFYAAWKRNLPAVLVAIPLALAVVLKLYPGMLIPLLLFRGRIREAILCTGMVVGLSALSVAVLPSAAWHEFLFRVVPNGGYGVLLSGSITPGVLHALGVNAFTARVFLGNDVLKPVYYSPVLARAVPAAICGLVVLCTWGLSWRARRRAATVATPLDPEFGLYLAAMVLVAPLAWENHLTYALPAMLVLLIRCVFAPERGVGLRLLAAAAVLVAAWPQFMSVVPDRFGLLLAAASVKFFAVAATWAVLAKIVHHCGTFKGRPGYRGPGYDGTVTPTAHGGGGGRTSPAAGFGSRLVGQSNPRPPLIASRS